MLAGYYKRKQRESFKYGLWKVSKSFWRKKRGKKCQYVMSDLEISLKKKKEKKCQYCCEQCKKFLEDKKQRLVDI